MNSSKLELKPNPEARVEAKQRDTVHPANPKEQQWSGPRIPSRVELLLTAEIRTPLRLRIDPAGAPSPRYQV